MWGCGRCLQSQAAVQWRRIVELMLSAVGVCTRCVLGKSRTVRYNRYMSVACVSRSRQFAGIKSGTVELLHPGTPLLLNETAMCSFKKSPVD